MKCPCEDCISFAICNAKKIDLTFIDFMIILIFDRPVCDHLMNYIDGASNMRHIPGIPETKQYKLILKKIKRVYKYE